MLDNNHEDGSSQTEEDQRTVGKHFETLVSQAGKLFNLSLQKNPRQILLFYYFM